MTGDYLVGLRNTRMPEDSFFVVWYGIEVNLQLIVQGDAVIETWQ